MARRPPADPDALGAFYKRWTPYEDQRRNISDDLKTLFAELKASGLTPKSARIAFAEKYRVENQTADEADKRAASDEEVELYLSALARVRESDEDGVIEDNEPADREHITGSVGKEFPNNEPAPTAPQLSAAAAGSDPASEADDAEEPPQAEASSATQSTEEQTEQVAGQIGNALEQDRESGVTTQPVDTPHASNDDFRQVPVIGSIR